MADIDITTDFTQVNNLKEALKSADSLYVKVVDSVLRENNRLSRLLKKAAKDTEENSKLKAAADAAYSTKLQQEADKRERARAKEVAKAEKEAQRLEAINQKLIASEVKLRAEMEKRSAATAQGYQSQIGQNLGLGAQGISAGASASAFEGEIERLRNKYDQIYASSQLYERSLNELNKAHALGVLSTKQHEAAVESLNLEYQNFQNGVVQTGNRFSQYTAQSASGMNSFGVVTQQAGYQIGDFLVQVQSGTNWMVAFGQQATQLVGVLPLMGAGFMGLSTGGLVALSAGLGIAIPLVTALGAAWMRTREDTDSAASSVETLDQKLKSLDSTVQQWLTTKAAAAAGMTVEEFVGTQGVDQAVEDMARAEEAYNALLERIATSNQTNIGGPGSAMGLAIANMFAVGNAEEEIAKAEEAYTASVERLANLNQKQLDERFAAFREERMLLEERAELELATIRYGEESAQVKALVAAQERRVYEESLNSKITNEAMVDILMDQYDRQVRIADGAKTWNDRVRTVKGILDSINGMSLQVGLKINTTISGLPGASWAAGIWEKANELAWQGDLAGNPTASRPPPKAPPMLGESILPDVGGGSGGGGAASDPLQDLRDQLKLEEELLGLSEAEAQVLKALGEDRSRYSQAEIDAITREIEAFERKKKALEEQQGLYDTLKSSMEDAFMSIITGTESAKDAFKSMAYEVIKELYKVLVVQRMVGSFDASSGVGSGLVGLIGGALGGITGANASGGTMMANKAYLVGEKGPELVIPRHSGTVVNADLTGKAAGSSGNLVVNNNITVTGSDAAMVRMEVAKMIPQITSATKAAVIDAKQRGGQMSSAFR